MSGRAEAAADRPAHAAQEAAHAAQEAAHDPAFATEDEARAALIAACLALEARGVNQGKAGNASLRWDRGLRPGLLVTPSALPYDRMRPDDIVWLSLALVAGEGGDADAALAARGERGEERPAVIDAEGRRPSSEWRIHRDLLVAQPAAAAVVHAHPPHATALACLPAVQAAGIPAFHYMVAAAGGGDIRCAPYATFGSRALSEAVLAALEGRRACLMAHHGIVAWGASLEAALALAVEVETLARMYHLACQLGEPAVLPADEMARVLAKFADYRPQAAPRSTRPR